MYTGAHTDRLIGHTEEYLQSASELIPSVILPLLNQFFKIRFPEQIAGSWGGGFFIADPIFVPKFLMPDSKRVTNVGPWSHKNGTAWFLTPKKTADADPMACDPRSHPSDPLSYPDDPWSDIPRYDPEIGYCIRSEPSVLF